MTKLTHLVKTSKNPKLSPINVITTLTQLMQAVSGGRLGTPAKDKPSFDLVAFGKEFREFEKLNDQAKNPNRFRINEDDCYPCLDDRHEQHEIDKHYVNHTAWAARVLARLTPSHHVDISSYLYFPTIVSAFVPVTYYDYRHAALKLDNLITDKADLTNMAFASNSIGSLSCMHVVEHIG